MHSNFITPPDLVESILIIDATEEEILACAESCKATGKPYNVYFYNYTMKDYNWLSTVIKRVDYTLIAETSDVPVISSTKYGPGSELKSPADYFK
jgi:hypothetical protein